MFEANSSNFSRGLISLTITTLSRFDVAKHTLSVKTRAWPSVFPLTLEALRRLQHEKSDPLCCPRASVDRFPCPADAALAHSFSIHHLPEAHSLKSDSYKQHPVEKSWLSILASMMTGDCLHHSVFYSKLSEFVRRPDTASALRLQCIYSTI